jgi:hypothetical protein
MSDLIARLRHEAIARSGYAHEYADGRTVWHPVCNEAADALEAQAKRIAELEEDIDRNDEWAKGFIEKTDARIAELEEENAKFRAMYDEQLLMAVKVSAAYLGEKG